MKAIFLDRDNTLVDDPGYLSQVSQVKLLPGVIEALKIFGQLGFQLFVVSNQSGVGRGLFTTKEVLEIEDYLQQILKVEGISILEFKYCYHQPSDQCLCRKPSGLMIEELISKYHIQPQGSFMVGDRLSDALAGKNAGVNGILLGKHNTEEFPTYPHLLSFAQTLG